MFGMDVELMIMILLGMIAVLGFGMARAYDLNKKQKQNHEELTKFIKTALEVGKNNTTNILKNKETLKDYKGVIENLSTMGIDVHYKSMSWITIYSPVKGGQVREFPVRIDSYRDLRDITDELKRAYGTGGRNIIEDNPQFRNMRL